MDKFLCLLCETACGNPKIIISWLGKYINNRRHYQSYQILIILKEGQIVSINDTKTKFYGKPSIIKRMIERHANRQR